MTKKMGKYSSGSNVRIASFITTKTNIIEIVILTFGDGVKGYCKIQSE